MICLQLKKYPHSFKIQGPQSLQDVHCLLIHSCVVGHQFLFQLHGLFICTGIQEPQPQLQDTTYDINTIVGLLHTWVQNSYKISWPLQINNTKSHFNNLYTTFYFAQKDLI